MITNNFFSHKTQNQRMTSFCHKLTWRHGHCNTLYVIGIFLLTKSLEQHFNSTCRKLTGLQMIYSSLLYQQFKVTLWTPSEKHDIQVSAESHRFQVKFIHLWQVLNHTCKQLGIKVGADNTFLLRHRRPGGGSLPL